MNEKPEELPKAVGGVEGESDIVAERSGAETQRSRRPVPADPPELQAQRERPENARGSSQEESRPDSQKAQQDADEVTRPDAGPTG
ncbi:hypothetical protein [Nonomuraea sp. 10N515B]|uniref:hypothetical protein n=1 Tax=Nonomuraea sp. 10N515B TaxID=3457422 RepID=UPI003FCD34BA